VLTVLAGLTGLAGLGALANRRTAGPAVSRLEGRQLAQRELARPIYHPSLLSRLGTRVADWFESLTFHGLPSPLDWLLAVLLGLGILALIGGVMYYAGPARFDRRYPGVIVEGSQRSAAEHRSAADQFAAARDYRSAIIERVRAIAADLESRQILPARPGRTAAELGAEAALAIPAEATALGEATHLFDDVRYGGRAGNEDGYQQVRDLDLRIRAVPIQVSAIR
jgi:Domain of unknown function (DUF4129)